MINLNNVNIVFSDVVIKYKDFTFKKGEITFISGPNGSGKTTLLKAIANIIDHKGEIDRNGFVTFVSQKPILFSKTIYQNIIYPLEIRKLDISNYENRIEKYVKLFELDKILHKKAKSCSSGEQMKASILRGIIFEPDVLLLDEPTTALDIKSIEELTKLLNEIKKDMTIIISSHDRLFIEELNDVLYELGDPYV